MCQVPGFSQQARLSTKKPQSSTPPQHRSMTDACHPVATRCPRLAVEEPRHPLPKELSLWLFLRARTPSPVGVDRTWTFHHRGVQQTQSVVAKAQRPRPEQPALRSPPPVQDAEPHPSAAQLMYLFVRSWKLRSQAAPSNASLPIRAFQLLHDGDPPAVAVPLQPPGEGRVPSDAVAELQFRNHGQRPWLLSATAPDGNDGRPLTHPRSASEQRLAEPPGRRCDPTQPGPSLRTFASTPAFPAPSGHAMRARVCGPYCWTSGPPSNDLRDAALWHEEW
mmetsp:Transcript_20453/g.63614  ORF Transcript_20453/g.63614 Transcript_20453/m.63614 type:complete len:278 (-) Transcript_20453:327-1160(-)